MPKLASGTQREKERRRSPLSTSYASSQTLSILQPQEASPLVNETMFHSDPPALFRFSSTIVTSAKCALLTGRDTRPKRARFVVKQSVSGRSKCSTTSAYCKSHACCDVSESWVVPCVSNRHSHTMILSFGASLFNVLFKNLGIDLLTIDKNHRTIQTGSQTARRLRVTFCIGSSLEGV